MLFTTISDLFPSEIYITSSIKLAFDILSFSEENDVYNKTFSFVVVTIEAYDSTEYFFQNIRKILRFLCICAR
jgi:hypothetical protein